MQRLFPIATLVVAMLALFVASSHAQTTPAGQRIALIVGNARYDHVPALANPGNDASGMADALKRLGFEVQEEHDLDLRQMQVALERFARRASSSETALIYYAGHGLQVAGENYLVPVDAELKDEISVFYQTLHINEIFKALERAPGTRLLFLDACRNLSLPGTGGDTPMLAGLAKVDARRNMVIGYATAATEVAYDGLGRHSFFTGAVLEQIETPGLEISQMMLRLAATVSERTGGKQVPELSRTLTQEFYFVPPRQDEQLWAQIRAASDPAVFEDFLARFPESPLAGQARARLALLRPAPAPAPPVEAPAPAAPSTGLATAAPQPGGAPVSAPAGSAEEIYREERILAEEQRLREEHRRRLENERRRAESAEAARLWDEELRLHREYLSRGEEAVREALERQRILEDELRLRREHALREQTERRRAEAATGTPATITRDAGAR